MPRDESLEDAPDSIVELAAAEPIGALSVALLRSLPGWKGRPCLFIAQSERRADLLGRILRALSPKLDVALFPAWDNLPYDRVPPSRTVMGHRASVLRWLTDLTSLPDVVLTTPMAAIRRVPPRGIWSTARAEFRVGERLDQAMVSGRLTRLGYVFDERVDSPGEAALRGRVIDLFPAAAPLPCRIEHEDGRIVAIHSYDPLTQRTQVETERQLVDPASEFLTDAGAEPEEPLDASQPLSGFYPHLETLFDYLAKAPIVFDSGAADRATDFFELIAEAHISRKELPRVGGQSTLPPDREYLRPEEWERHVARQL